MDQRLQKFIEILQEAPTRHEFMQAMEQVMQIVRSMHDTNARTVDNIEKTYASLISRVQADHTSSLDELKSKVDHVFVQQVLDRILNEHGGRLEQVDRKLAEVDAKMKTVRSGDRGPKGDRGDRGPQGPTGTVDTAVVDELRGEIARLKRAVTAAASTGRGMRKVPIVRPVNLTAQCDGSNKAFTLPKDTVRVLGVFGTQFPITFDADNDFTFKGTTLTLADAITAPASGQTLWGLTEALFYA